MIRLSKMTDYGLVLLTYIAKEPERTETARNLSELTGLPLPTVSKVLKILSREGILQSHRGKQGGYGLSRAPEETPVVDVIAAIDGPIALTDCSIKATHACEFEERCPVRDNWQIINASVVSALSELTLAQLRDPISEIPGPAKLVRIGGVAERSDDATENVS